MILNINDIYPIREIDGNCAFGHNGDITFMFSMLLPEKYSLGENDFDQIHLERFRFYSMLPSNTVVHNQHFYLNSYFEGFEKNNTFLQKAANNHFKGRAYTLQLSYIYITLTNIKSLKKNYTNSGIIKNTNHIIKTDLNIINEFSKAVNRAVTFLNNSNYIFLTPLTEEEIQNITLNYITGLNGAKLTDIEFKPKFKIGDNYFNTYALIHHDNLPPKLNNIVEDRAFSTSENPYYKGYFEPVGLEFEHNHIINQFVYLDEHKDHLKELNERVSKLNQFSKFGRENKVGAEKLEEHIDTIYNDTTTHLMRSHINIFTWSKDEKELSSIDSKLISSMQQIDLLPYCPKNNDHIHYFLSGIPANAGCMPRQETFNFDLKKSICFDITESNYIDDEKGIVFNDRINNLPVKKDVYFEPYESKIIFSRNFYILAPTGGGKSVLLKKITRYFHEEDFTCIIIDLGGGFDIFTKLYPDDSLYIQYEHGKPLGINPFLISDIKELTADKIETLRDFISILWLKGETIEDNYRVSLGKIIKFYYKNYSGKYDFYTFFEFVKKQSNAILTELDIDPEFFPIKEFLHRLSEYYKDGTFEFLFRDHQQNQSFKDKKLIVFELDSIRENYQVLPVVLSMIRDTIENLVFKDKTGKKLIFFEEAAKTMQIPVMFNSINYYYQTGRKFGCATGMALQYINNVPTNELGNAIVQNTHVYYIFEHDQGFKQLKERCGFSDHTIYQIKSLRSNLKSDRPFTEFVMVRGKMSNVLRLELPIEELLCYQSEGDNVQLILNEYNQTNDMETAITNIIKTNYK